MRPGCHARPGGDSVKVAALFVQRGGVYWGLPGVDPWDEERDARRYTGPHPVVAHPPCARWSKLANVNRARYGIPIGADGGCFASALASVRVFGGVLEHPAESIAWRWFDLPRPQRKCWSRGLFGDWVTEVCQRNYGHRAEKRTWLLAAGLTPPALDWSPPEPPEPPEAWCSTDRPMAQMTVELMGKKERLATPIPFRDLLLSIARSAR